LYAAVQLVDNTFFIIVGPFALPVGANIWTDPLDAWHLHDNINFLDITYIKIDCLREFTAAMHEFCDRYCDSLEMSYKMDVIFLHIPNSREGAIRYNHSHTISG
jgi:hypothetical protein